MLSDVVEDHVAIDRTGGRDERRIEFVKVPAEPVDIPCSFCDKVFTVISEQADLAFGAVELGCWKVRFT